MFLGGGRITSALVAGLRRAGHQGVIVVHDRNPEKLDEHCVAILELRSRWLTSDPPFQEQTCSSSQWGQPRSRKCSRKLPATLVPRDCWRLAWRPGFPSRNCVHGLALGSAGHGLCQVQSAASDVA